MDVGVDTLQKALQINLDPRWYGTFAEIGAGQEVVRWFFRVGGAAGTVAKTMSAYDMAVSDAIYGKSDRYVSRARLQAMLDHEYQLNLERLDDARGDDTAFFAFADTVAARSYHGHQRVPRLDGREVPVPPARRAQPDHPARAHARRARRPAAGGARHRRREPAARRVLPAPRAGAAGREPARRPHHRPHRDRHDRVHGHRVPAGRQPADGAEARAARPERRGDVRPRPARCCSPARCCARRRSWSSGAASGRRPSSTSTCSSAAREKFEAGPGGRRARRS